MNNPVESFDPHEQVPPWEAADSPAEAVESAGQEPVSGEPEQAACQPKHVQTRRLGFISPAVARMAEEYSLDLTQVTGTGEGGRITRRDVLAYFADPGQRSISIQAEEPEEGPDLFSAPGLVIGRSTADVPPELEYGQKNAYSIVHLPVSQVACATSVMEANLQHAAAHRAANAPAFARDGVRLTFSAYFAAAVAGALKSFPQVNCVWNEQGPSQRPEVNLGLKVALGDEGPLIPVIMGADGLSLLGMARAMADLTARARAHQLRPEELTGGTFTLANQGINGSLFTIPILNMPQCGILGVGAIQKRVVVIDDAIAIRPMVYLSFTYDPRVLDGVRADAFLAKVTQNLQEWA